MPKLEISPKFVTTERKNLICFESLATRDEKNNFIRIFTSKSIVNYFGSSAERFVSVLRILTVIMQRIIFSYHQINYKIITSVYFNLARPINIRLLTYVFLFSIVEKMCTILNKLKFKTCSDIITSITFLEFVYFQSPNIIHRIIFVKNEKKFILQKFFQIL